MAGDDQDEVFVEGLTRRWIDETLVAARTRGREAFEASVDHARWHLGRGDIVCSCEPPWPRHCVACGEPDPLNWHDGGLHCGPGRAAYRRTGMTMEAIARAAW